MKTTTELPITVLITGVAGFMGSRLADWILEKIPNSTVIGIDNLSGGFIDNVNKRVIFFNRNLYSDDISEIFQKYQPQYVYHLAAYAAEGLSPFIRIFNYKSNLLSTANVINNCLNYNVKRLVFTSSMAVYGNGKPPFDEDDLPAPIDPYGIAKYACEQDVKVAGVQFGLDWCIIRPHNVYGVKQNIWDQYRNVLGKWMYLALHGMPLTIFGDGEQKRAFSFIDDCLEPLWKAAILPEASKQIINLGGVKEYTINEANQILREVIGEREVIYLEGRHEVKIAHPTYEKSIILLGYSDNTTLKEGLKIFWEWACRQKDRERWVKSIEVKKGLYQFWKFLLDDENKSAHSVEKTFMKDCTLTEIFHYFNNKNDDTLILEIYYNEMQLYNSKRPFISDYQRPVLEVINQTKSEEKSSSYLLKIIVEELRQEKRDVFVEIQNNSING
jgi:UDP-glucose 4-epimerase